MDTTLLPPDFREFLRLLNSNNAEYLIIGGYAVGYHGYPRPTGDLDIWISNTPDNAERVLRTLEEFGFACPIALLLQDNQVFRMGIAPLRIEVLTTIDGVRFPDCYAERVQDEIDGIQVSVISLARLKENKNATGRLKDAADLDHLRP